MTLLEQYNTKLGEMNDKIRAGQLPPEEMLVYQELVYRIAVLNTCKAFCAGAPVTMETAKLCCHYQVVAMYIKMLSGDNTHHMIEAMFKAFARALDEATSFDPRITDILSTKGSL